MTSPDKIKRAKQLCAQHPNHELGDLREFRCWILSLLTQLSELCESDHTQSSHYVAREHSIRPFRNRNVTKRGVCEDLRRIMSTPLSLSEKRGHGMGYVYVLRSQMGASTIGELKIGFSKYHPEHRAHELAQCLARPEIISHTPLLPHAKRLESIIHTELQACRKVQSCPKCCKDHREWFTVSHADSREVVTRWSKWILKRPYLDGKLTDEWEEYLMKKDFGSINDNMPLAEFWKAVITEFHPGEPKETESQRIGKYLNECYWDYSFEQLGLTYYEKEHCDALREDLDLVPDGRPISVADVMDAGVKKLRELQVKDQDDKGKYYKYDRNSSKYIPVEEALRSGKSSDGQIHPDMPITAIFGTDTQIGRMFHPEAKLRHVVNLQRRSLPWEESEPRDATEDMIKFYESLKTLKTGGASVSNPALGITESPLGDATLLPVLSIKDLKYFNLPVANWVGMSPTNAGFQYVQEAYAKGKWIGKKPRFQLPKAFRKAGYKRLSAADAVKAPSPGGREKEKAKDCHTTSVPSENELDPNQKHDGPSFQLIRGPDGDRFEWTAPNKDELRQRTNEYLEEIRNGGRANAEKRFAKSLHYYGVDTFSDISSDDDTTDPDSSVSGDSSSSEEEERDGHLRSSSASPSMVPAKRKATSSAVNLVNSKKAKMWLESL